MKKRKLQLNYINALKYLALFAVLYVFNFIIKEAAVFSAAPFVVALCLKSNVFLSTALFMSALVLSGNSGIAASMAILAIFFSTVILLYRHYKTEMKGELAAFMTISLLGYVFLGDIINKNVLPIDKRILYSIITVGLTLLLWISGSAVVKKGLKFKFSGEELLTFAAFSSLFGLGICNAFSPYLFRAAAVFIILLSCFVYRLGVSTMFALVLGISLSVYYKNINYVSLFLIWSMFAQAFMPYSKYLAAIFLVAADYCSESLFGVYGAYILKDLIFMLSGGVAFVVIPTSLLKTFKDKLYAFREKQLIKKTINRNRTNLSNKLFELSGVFSEMSAAFCTLKEAGENESVVKEKMLANVLNVSCSECENNVKCNQKKEELVRGLKKLIEIGFAKGKLSFIDLPKDFSEVCMHPNNVIFALNKMLLKGRENAINEMNALSGREIIAEQAEGVSKVLRTLALESGTQLKFTDKAEKALSDALYKKGYEISELLIYGEGDDLSVGLILAMKEFPIDGISSVISSALSKNMVLTEKNDISNDKCYLSFSVAAKYDAVFGLSSVKKDGSSSSGDTHSVVRIADDKFLVALSDGMGSGEKAKTVSSVSLSLIESFYKAGIGSDLILNTVNKLLAINTEDSFTALDVSVINLKTCTADFIKYGAPYGFIVGDDGIKIVESSSLPLGILSEIKPSCVRADLKSGDVLILVTDGISDAFGSSSEMIEFLRSVPALNPQTLADNILNRALSLSDGEKKDDMTVLCVRLFAKKPPLPACA